jgi:replicative DNA helicase
LSGALLRRSSYGLAPLGAIPQFNPYAAELIVAKHRNGPTPTIPLRWVPEFGRFEDLDVG